MNSPSSPSQTCNETKYKLTLTIRFNHRGPGREDVGFESRFEVCERCGRPKCSCFPSQSVPDCRQCAESHQAECIYPPRKRVKLGRSPVEAEEDEPDLKTVDVAVLDPNTRLWTTENRQIEDRSALYDTCDLVLTRDITECRQLYNNYGNLNNQKLISTYGFFDPDCRTDFVSFHRELFHETSIVRVPAPIAKFWMDHGFETLQRLAAEHDSTLAMWNELMSYRDLDIRTTGEEFVYWSLSFTDKGPSLTCLVWAFLCYRFDGETECPAPGELEVAIRNILSYLFITRPVFDCTPSFNVVVLLNKALELRMTRYKDGSAALSDLLTRSKDPSQNPQHLWRLNLAFEMVRRETRILINGHKAICRICEDFAERSIIDLHPHRASDETES